MSIATLTEIEALEALARAVPADDSNDAPLGTAFAQFSHLYPELSVFNEALDPATVLSIIAALREAVEALRPFAEFVSGVGGLREKLKLKYLGNCKCGKCQLVEAELITEAADAIASLIAGGGAAETVCEACGRHVQANPQPASGFVAPCGKRLTRIDECRAIPGCPVSPGISDEEVEAKALADFTDYFVKNYPGPETIIGNPRWHAPKIFRAAHAALLAARKAGRL